MFAPSKKSSDQLSVLKSRDITLPIKVHLVKAIGFPVVIYLCAAAAAKSLQSCLDSVWPHRRQPTRLPCPWNSPGKNTGVDCHFLLQCMKVKSESEVAQLFWLLATPWTAAHQAPPWDFLGKSTGVGCHCLLRSPSLGQTKKTLCLFVSALIL